MKIFLFIGILFSLCLGLANAATLTNADSCANKRQTIKRYIISSKRPASFTLPTAKQKAGIDYVTDEVLVYFNDKVDLMKIIKVKSTDPILKSKNALLKSIGVNNSVAGFISLDNYAVLKTNPGQSVAELINELKLNEFVQVASPNYYLKSD